LINLRGGTIANTAINTLFVLLVVHGFLRGLGKGNFAKDATANLGGATGIAARITSAAAAMHGRSIGHLTRIQKAQIIFQIDLLSKFQFFPSQGLGREQGSKLKYRQSDRVEYLGVRSTVSDSQLRLRHSCVQDGPDALDEELNRYHEHRGLKHEFVGGDVIILNVIR